MFLCYVTHYKFITFVCNYDCSITESVVESDEDLFKIDLILNFLLDWKLGDSKISKIEKNFVAYQ